MFTDSKDLILKKICKENIIEIHFLFERRLYSYCTSRKPSQSIIMSIKLNTANLGSLSSEVRIPTYDRSAIKAGIVHVGIGGFHRSHQAYYTDLLMEHHGVTDWGICGVALLKYDRRIFDTLVAQNGLYTLLITSPDGTPSASVIGSIVEYLYAPDNSEAVIEKMASPDIKIITLTITEGGYNMNTATGEFQEEDPAILKDIQNPTTPETIFGYLTQALKRRRDRGLSGLTIQSCDNIQQNGEVTRKMLLSYVRLADPGLLDWILSSVSFPNAMVDRITPVTSPADIASLQQRFSVDDAWPVVCEPFCQWVIEDTFSAGRPAWDLVGAQFVEHVHSYEKMKIRMLNGGHSTIAFAGILHTFEFIYETMADPLFSAFLNDFMEFEVTPILDPVPGIDLASYRQTLIQRFSNPNIKDQLTRIVSETAAKAPKFLVATINDHLTPYDAAASGENGGGGEDVSGVRRCALVLAAWCRYLELSVGDVSSGRAPYVVQDAQRELLVQYATASLEEGRAAHFLNIKSIFGDLAQHEAFSALYQKMLLALRKHGIVHVLTHFDEL